MTISEPELLPLHHILIGCYTWYLCNDGTQFSQILKLEKVFGKKNVALIFRDYTPKTDVQNHSSVTALMFCILWMLGVHKCKNIKFITCSKAAIWSQCSKN